MQSLVFLGASTAFHEILGIIDDINTREPRYVVVAILDDNKSLHGSKVGTVTIEGDLDCVNRYPNAKFIFGIGSFKNRLVRNQILKRLGIPDERFETLIHPSAKVYPSAKIGAGCIVHGNVVICNDVDLEAFSIITFNSVIGPHSRIGRGAMITTLVVVLSGVKVGAFAFVGAGSSISENVRIGPGAMIGMATTVARHIPPGAFFVGNPGRVLYTVAVPSELLESWNA